MNVQNKKVFEEALDLLKADMIILAIIDYPDIENYLSIP